MPVHAPTVSSRFRGLALLAAVAAGCGMDSGAERTGVTAREPPGREICVRGRLTAEGVECPALRGSDGRLYTLAGDLGGFRVGDEVCVCGVPVGFSICMQGTTLSLGRLGRDCPRSD